MNEPMRENVQILLAARPRGIPRDSDFRTVTSPVPALQEGQFLVENEYLSMDAGFRQWMNEGTSDNYLQAMALDAPVMSITLGRIVDSRHPEYPVGTRLVGRHAWERYSVADGSDFETRLPAELPFPPSWYLGVLGTTGLTAYFGMVDVARVQPGDVVLVSAAAGAVGSVAGQIARVLGARTVGLTGADEKCRWLVQSLGYDAAVNYRRHADLGAAILDASAGGIDVYFDNVGGRVLEAALGCMRVGARVVLCGAMENYVATEPVPGPANLFEAITKRATLKGFMFSDYVDEYPRAMAQIGEWLREGLIRSVEEVVDGIEHTPAAFRRLFEGANRGKLVVRVR